MTPAQHNDTILVTVRGPDRPGITAKLTDVIARCEGVSILDIEQTIVHHKLLLSILLQFPHGRAERTSVLKELLFAAQELGVSLDFEAFDRNALDGERNKARYALTCLGAEVGAKPLAAISGTLSARGVNIAKISKMSDAGLACVELLIELPRTADARALAKELLALSHEIDTDIAIQPANLSRRAKRLVVMDMDSTLVAAEAIEELARAAGKFKQVQAITRRAMEGKMDFSESLAMRVALLKGLPVSAVDKAVREMKLNRGAERLIRVLKRLGYSTAVISGGFTQFTEHLKEKLGLDYAFANTLEIKNEQLTGRVVGSVIDGARKAMILETIAQGEGVTLDQVIAVGDGANDILMLSKAGMGVAFHAKDVVKRAAHASIGKHAGLDSLLYLLGISERELAGIA